MIKLETNRLIIRDHIESDIDGLHSVLSDKDLMFYIQDIATSNFEESLANLNFAMEEAKSSHRTCFFFAIIDKETNEYIGNVGTTKLRETVDGNVMELGYFIKREYWGKGIVTEAAKEVIKFCFEDLGTLKIETGCNADNTASEKIMKKLGMIKEADLKLKVVIDGKFYDRVEYRLLKSEYASLFK
jgi:ribosomal-protein-alanine N-acetyltransferase